MSGDRQSALKKVVRKIRKEAVRQIRGGWRDELVKQTTRGWGEELALHIFGTPRRRRHRSR